MRAVRLERLTPLVSEVLAVNYYGEVLTTELLAHLLATPQGQERAALLTRQLLDETRHAHLTRSLLLSRGYDPLERDARDAFTFAQVFESFARRPADEVLAFLAENERLAAAHFHRLIELGRKLQDAELVALYSEITTDEVNHANALLSSLDGSDPRLRGVRAEARSAMQRCVNLRYLRLARESS